MIATQLDTFLYDISIPAISTLQSRLSDQAPLMQSLSIIFDPKYAFLIYSPIAYLLDRNVGKKLIMTTVLAEWLNQVLKWLLHGERPYWYVHSSGHFDAKHVPISQFPVTCELGPGHPSGHAMVTSAVWYVILNSLLKAYLNYCSTNHSPTTEAIITKANSIVNGHRNGINNNNNVIDQAASKSAQSAKYAASGYSPDTTKQRQLSTRAAQIFTWVSYFGLIAAVSVSRVFLGCHFPHQCLAGAALGLILARWVCSYESKAGHYIAASAVLFASAFGTFGILQMFGFDPAWTIQLAMKHCVKREYIHLDTAPFFSIMRYCGFALGCGLGLMFPLRRYAPISIPLPAKDVASIVADGSKEDLIDFSDDQVSANGDDIAPVKRLFTSRAISWLSAKVLMALVMARLVDNLGLFVSHANLNLFYSAAFAGYTLFSYAFINL